MRCDYCNEEAIGSWIETEPDEPIVEIVDESRVKQFTKLGCKVYVGQEIRWATYKLITTHYYCQKHEWRGK